MLAIAKKKLKIKHTLYEILQYISIAPFEKTPLHETFSEAVFKEMQNKNGNQLKIF